MHSLDASSQGGGTGARAPESARSRRARETAELFQSLAFATDGERDQLRQQIVLLNSVVAVAVSRRYHGRGVDRDDLDQTACLALVRAVRTFDPDRGHDFLSFAVPTIVGGLKQHFRDQGWAIRVPRRVQEVQLLIDRAGLPEADESRYGVATVLRLAERLDLTTGEVEAALRARGCFSPASLDRAGSRTRLVDGTGVGGTEEHDAVELRAMLAPLLLRLAPRDQKLLRLRFGEDRTQQSIAAELQLTQAQVSRLLTRVVAELRADLGTADPTASAELAGVVGSEGHTP